MNSKISNGKGHLVIKHSPHLLLRLYVIMYGLLVSLSLTNRAKYNFPTATCPNGYSSGRRPRRSCNGRRKKKFRLRSCGKRN